MSEEIEFVGTYLGKDMREMSKAELIQAFVRQHEQHQRELESKDRQIELFRDAFHEQRKVQILSEDESIERVGDILKSVHRRPLLPLPLPYPLGYIGDPNG